MSTSVCECGKIINNMFMSEHLLSKKHRVNLFIVKETEKCLRETILKLEIFKKLYEISDEQIDIMFEEIVAEMSNHPEINPIHRDKHYWIALYNTNKQQLENDILEYISSENISIFGECQSFATADFRNLDPKCVVIYEYHNNFYKDMEVLCRYIEIIDYYYDLSINRYIMK